MSRSASIRKPEYMEISDRTMCRSVWLMLISLAFGVFVISKGVYDHFQPGAPAPASAATPAATSTGELDQKLKTQQKPGELAWLGVNKSNKQLILLCGKAMEVAESYRDTTGRIKSTNFYCNKAAAQLKINDRPGCIKALNELPNSIYDDAMNIITTKGNIALACNDQKEFDRLVDTGRAADPVNPVFNFGYNGTLEDDNSFDM